MKKFVATVGVSLGACVLMISLAGASGVRRVDVEDRCDPETFNAAIGEGTCVVDLGVTFDEFLEELNPVDFGHDKWRFNFGRGRVDSGETLQAVNRGGEFHTFTEVAEYGGGCVPELNGPLGLTPVAECADLTEVAPTVFVPTAFLTSGIDAGGTLNVDDLDRGTHKFQCLIHPWMRQDVTVR